MRNAIIYGGGGSIGGAVAEAFARDGLRVHLTGRTRSKLDAVAARVAEAGGEAEVAVVDALDEKAVDEHARSVVDRFGSIDVSLSLVTRGDVQGIPLVDMSTEDLLRAVVNGVTATFVTARAAARQMVTQGSGVILALNSGSAYGSPMMGSTGPADSAIDTFVRNLAQEIGPRGVRVLGMWVAGVPETLTKEKLSEVDASFADEAKVRGVIEHLDGLRMLRKSPSLEHVAELAAFLASDRSWAVTGSFVNATGMFPH